jgi:hypothetical protein
MRRETWFWLALLLTLVLVTSTWDRQDPIERSLREWRGK